MIEIEINGIDGLLRSFDKIKIKETLDKAMKKFVFTLERTAKINTPVDTGLLRNSYETMFEEGLGTLRNYRLYAPYVEAKQGFLQKTIEQEENNIQSIFDREIIALIQSL